MFITVNLKKQHGLDTAPSAPATKFATVQNDHKNLISGAQFVWPSFLVKGGQIGVFASFGA
jgi:hypothetical protein